jgi:hypothetical protein
MKKIFSILIINKLIIYYTISLLFTACGPSMEEIEAEVKAKADSARYADSISSISVIVLDTNLSIESDSKLEEQICQNLFFLQDSINKIFDKISIEINEHENGSDKIRNKACTSKNTCKIHQNKYKIRKTISAKIDSIKLLIKNSLSKTSISFRKKLFEHKKIALKKELQEIEKIILNHNFGKGEDRCIKGANCTEHIKIFQNKKDIKLKLDSVNSQLKILI